MLKQTVTLILLNFILALPDTIILGGSGKYFVLYNIGANKLKANIT